MEEHINKKRKLVDNDEPLVKSEFLKRLPPEQHERYQRLDKYFIGLPWEDVYDNRYSFLECLEYKDRVVWKILCDKIGCQGELTDYFPSSYQRNLK